MGRDRRSALRFLYKESVAMSASQIVLIEDNPADVLLVEMALKENDVSCELTTFSSGREALRILCPPAGTETSAFVPDAILLDLNMPKSDGFEVPDKLKHTPHLAHVPVAIITSSRAAKDKARTYRLGAIRYVQKPSQLEEFFAKVGQAVKELLAVKEMPKAKPASSARSVVNRQRREPEPKNRVR